MIESINAIASIGALLVGAFGIYVLLFLLFKKPLGLQNTTLCTIGLAVSLGSVIISLVYSNILGFPPCVLCWYQRIFIYPQVIIFTLALVRNYPKKLVGEVALSLTSIGLLFSLYHILITYTNFSPIVCDAAVSCTQRFVFTFGFMTIPLMAFCIFLALLGISLHLTKRP